MFTPTDAIIVHALFNPAANDYKSKLREIISFADYVNHAILTYEEVSACFGRLKANGLIEVTHHSVNVTPRGHHWRSAMLKNTKTSVYKRLKEIETNLNASFVLLQPDEGTLLDRILFDNVVTAYLQNDRQ